jgi:glucosyl-dolichyl phosphate glucuronosyltransferase
MNASKATFDISAIVATRNRLSALRSLLQSFSLSDNMPRLEVIVVENGTNSDVGSAANHCADFPFTVVWLSESRASKSQALNRALDLASGQLLLFTDDDVTFDRSTLDAYRRATDAYPNAAIFCGPIAAVHPRVVPTWLRCHPYATILFAHFTPAVDEGPLPDLMSPLGPNFAVRASALGGARFDTRLGPQDGFPLFCEDTEFLQRLRSKHTDGRSPQVIFLPGASVNHHYQQDSLQHFDTRFFNLGRSHVIRFGRISHLCSSPALLSFRTAKDVSTLFSAACELAYYCGQRHEFRVRGDEMNVTRLQQFLLNCRLPSHEEILRAPPGGFLELARVATGCLPTGSMSSLATLGQRSL